MFWISKRDCFKENKITNMSLIQNFNMRDLLILGDTAWLCSSIYFPFSHMNGIFSLACCLSLRSKTIFQPLLCLCDHRLSSTQQSGTWQFQEPSLWGGILCLLSLLSTLQLGMGICGLKHHLVLWGCQLYPGDGRLESWKGPESPRALQNRAATTPLDWLFLDFYMRKKHQS